MREPPQLQSLYSEALLSATLDELVTKAEEFMQRLVTEDMVRRGIHHEEAVRVLKVVCVQSWTCDCITNKGRCFVKCVTALGEPSKANVLSGREQVPSSKHLLGQEA